MTRAEHLAADNKSLREQIEVQRRIIAIQRETMKQEDEAARTLHGMGWTFNGRKWITFMNQPRHMTNPNPAMHRDIDAAHKRCIDLRAERFQAKLARENALWRARALTLALLAILAAAVWLLSLEVARP